MADQATQTTTDGTAAAQPQNGQAQPDVSKITIPDGYELIPKSNMEMLRRYEQQARGATPFFSKAKELGFEKPEDFDRWSPVFKTFKTKGLNADIVRRVFESEGTLPGVPQHPDEPERLDPDKLREEMRNEMRRELALKDHEAASKNVPTALMKAAREAFPDASDYEIRRTVREIRAELEDHREKFADKHLYPDNHPLRNERFAVPNDSVVAEILGNIRKERSEADGADKAKKADKIKAGTTTTTAGPHSGSGPPKGGSDRGADGLPSVEKLMESARAKMAMRGR